jgi:hypothetical protein
MDDQRIRDLLAEADRHRAEAAGHLRRATACQVACTAARDQADAAWSDAITSYDEYLRRYLPEEWERRQMLADPAAEGVRRGSRAITDARSNALLGEDCSSG